MTTEHPDETEPQTSAADKAEAAAPHQADRPPTAEEARLAESNELDPEAGEHFDEMARIGAKVKGEGAVE